MRSNLAEEIETKTIKEQSNPVLDHNQTAPLKEISTDELTVPKGLTKLEIRVMSLIALVLFGLLLLNVQTDLKLATSSRNVQDLNSKIETTETEIDNLDQHVNELSRYDRIHEIANKYDLKLYEENILNLSPLE